MQRRLVVPVIVAAAWASATGCASVKPLDQTALAPVIAAQPEGTPAPAYEPVWTVVLRWYRSHPEPTAGDVACNFLTAMHRGSPCRAPTALVLRKGPTPVPFSREWLASLSSEGLLEGLCATDPHDCGAHNMATYIQLGDPSIDSLHAQLTVAEMGFNAAMCRPGLANVYGVIGAITFHLRTQDGAWRVERTEGGRLPVNVRCGHGAGTA